MRGPQPTGDVPAVSRLGSSSQDRLLVLGVVRNLPPFASVGTPFTYRIEIHNLSRRRLKGLLIAEDLSNPLPSFAAFDETREPEGYRRNRFDRRMGYYRWRWLISEYQRATSPTATMDS